MSEGEFRLLAADRYEEALKAGEKAAREFLEWLIHNSPVPEPWWKPRMTMAVLAAIEGVPSDEVPLDEFRRYEAFEARYRPGADFVARMAFNPYQADDPRSVEHRARYDRAVDAALALAGESDAFDDETATLLASMLRRALGADPSYRVEDARVIALYRLVSRLDRPRCLPVPRHVELACLTLKKILNYWEEPK